MTFSANDYMQWLEEKNPGEEEFLQAARELSHTLEDFLKGNSVYTERRILERLSEPDRILTFRIVWEDDDCNIHINRGFRVQHNNVIGPYKGGLRFHPHVNQSVLKFLAFEQTFKNALTSLPMGGAKGGSDFDPKGRSDREIMRFCQAFMMELFRHIGERVDVPAGDINVGSREIGYMYGQYKKITNRFSGALTGKGLEYGGSPMRPEATGFGLIYFVGAMLEEHGHSFEDKKICVSGAGNVATHAALKGLEMGAKILTLSNSSGTLVCEDGLTKEQVERVLQNGSHELEEMDGKDGCTFKEEEKPWSVECDIALPCATQNELMEDDAKTLVDNNVMLVAEGANMPCSADAKDVFSKNDILFGPAKAANAGGVALSGLEMSQNAAFETRERDQLGKQLKTIMCEVHDRCLEHAGDGKIKNYRKGADIAGFKKVADAMLAFGIV